MNRNLRLLSSLAALSALASAQAATSLFFALPGTNTALTALDPGAIGSTFSLSVFYASDVELLDGEILLGFDRSNAVGPTATPLDGLLDLAGTPAASVSAAPGVALNALSRAGGAGDGARPFGLSILSVSSTVGTLPATSGARLFDVSFKNLGVTAGKPATLSFHTSATAPLYRTSFIDGGLNEIAPGSTSVNVQAVPEPATFAALGLGALGLLRRRARRLSA